MLDMFEAFHQKGKLQETFGNSSATLEQVEWIKKFQPQSKLVL